LDNVIVERFWRSVRSVTGRDLTHAPYWGRESRFLSEDRKTNNERSLMNSDTNGAGSLRDMELEVEVQGREWMRRRLEEKLQAQVEQHGAIFPPPRPEDLASAPGKDATAHGLRRGRAQRLARKRSN
jgi:hypothetical protein